MALGVGALPNRLVDYFAIVGLSEQTQLRPDVGVDSGAIEAELLTRYPPDHADFTLDEQMLPWLCFPSDVRITEEQRSPYHHMFVLTKVDGICVYGFCYVLSEPMVGAVDDGDLLCLRRYIPKAICLLSHYPLFSPFRKLLEHLRAFSKSPESLDLPLECIISQIIHDLPLPSAGGPPTQMALYEEDPIVFQRAPNTHIEPLRIPVRRLLSLLHLDNVLLVLNALLLERKIILLGDRPMQLTEVAEVFTQLLFPLHWPYVYIPCLPNHLEDVLEAPLPFIVGTSPENINLDALPEDALIVDLKNDEVFVPPGAFPELPARPAAVLRSSLKIAITDGDKLNDAVVDRTVQQAFLSFFVSVVHDCEAHCLVRSSSTVLSADASGDSLDGATNFDIEGFIDAQPAESRAFYADFLSGQTFSNYLDEKLLGRSSLTRLFDDEMRRVKENGTVFFPPPPPNTLPPVVVPRASLDDFHMRAEYRDPSRLLRFPLFDAEHVPRLTRARLTVSTESPMRRRRMSICASAPGQPASALLLSPGGSTSGAQSSEEQRRVLHERLKMTCRELIMRRGESRDSSPVLAASVAAAHKEARVVASERMAMRLASALEAIFAHEYLPQEPRTTRAAALWQRIEACKDKTVAAHVEIINSLTAVRPGVSRGRAWVRFALEKRSLYATVEAVLDEYRQWAPLYSPAAFMRDENCRVAMATALLGLLETNFEGIFSDMFGVGVDGKRSRKQSSTLLISKPTDLKQQIAARRVPFSGGALYRSMNGHVAPPPLSLAIEIVKSSSITLFSNKGTPATPRAETPVMRMSSL